MLKRYDAVYFVIGFAIDIPTNAIILSCIQVKPYADAGKQITTSIDIETYMDLVHQGKTEPANPDPNTYVEYDTIEQTWIEIFSFNQVYNLVLIAIPPDIVNILVIQAANVWNGATNA